MSKDFIYTNNLRTQRELMQLYTHNMQNSESEGASALKPILKSAFANGAVNGAKIDEIYRKFDQFQADILYSAISSLESSTTALEKIRAAVEPQIDEDAILNHITSLSASLSQNSNIAAYDAQNIADYLSTTRSNIVSHINGIGEEIEADLNVVNDILEELHSCSMRRLTTSNSIEKASIDDSIHRHIMNLSEYISVNHYYDSKGMLNIRTKDGAHSLIGETCNKLAYVENPSSNNTATSKDWAIYIKTSDSEIHSNVFAAPGFRDDHKLDGRIAALVRAKSHTIPEALHNFDNIASGVAEFINATHNRGIASEGYKQLTSSRKTSLDSDVQFAGDFAIALFSQDSQTLISPVIKSQELRTKAGDNVTVRQLIREINELANKASHTTIDGLHDIQLAATPNQGANAMQFNFDLTHYLHTAGVGGSDITFTNVVATQNASNITVQQDLSAISAINNYDRQRSQASFSILNTDADLSTDAFGNITHPISVTATLEITTDGRPTRTVDVTFELDGTVDDIKHRRISAKTISPSTNDAQIISGLTPNLRAYLADDNGNEITNGSQDGFLKIESINPDVSFGINEMTSSITGHIGSEHRKNKGFSSFFGMNDMLVYSKEDDNSATIKIRENIIQDNTLIASNEMNGDQNFGSTSKITFNIGDRAANILLHAAEHDKMTFGDGAHKAFITYLSDMQNKAMIEMKKAEARHDAAENIHEAAADTFADSSSINPTDEIKRLAEIRDLYISTTEAAKFARSLNDILLRAFTI